jgi:hypothetical protein
MIDLDNTSRAWPNALKPRMGGLPSVRYRAMSVRKSECPERTYRCPCCKFKTLHGRGQDEICPVCFWQDDGQDESEAEEVWGGPNYSLSLRQAQRNYQKIGAVEEGVRRFVRKPLPDEI